MAHHETQNPNPPARPVGVGDPGTGAEARLAFLAGASRLLADSLDYETTLVTVAGLALPYLGVWCMVDVLEADGSIRRLAVIHPDPEKQVLARELHHRYPPHPEDAIGAPRVLRTRRSEIVPGVSDAVLVRASRDPEHLALLRNLGMGAFMTAPMVARGRMVGAMTFVNADAGREFGETDLALAEDLAARCAMAIDNARLYAEAEAARGNTVEANERLVISGIREQELAEEARAANRAKSEFLSTMSHEIRTPINAIVGYAELLEMGIPDPVTEGQKAHLERIRASSDHLLGLVNDVLDLAKVEAGRMTVTRERASALEVVSAATSLLVPQAAAGEIEIKSSGCADGEEPFYSGDGDRVRQILVNLLSNAVKFTKPGGRVTVSCGVVETPDPEARLAGEGSWVFLRVEDTGIGIAPEEAATVFDPFMQSEQGLTRTKGGTGLGLSISRELARLMDGDLTLRSEPGEGSRFTLWLPAETG